MKNTIRLLSLILTLSLLFSFMPIVNAAGASVNVDNKKAEIAGSDDFGRMLSSDVEEYQEQQSSGRFSVVGLTISENTATVEYASLENAILVVSIYTEDGLRMLTSGSTEVNAGETEAVVILAGDMPQYFLASAYLLDTYDYSPLCEPYHTPMYTQEMQELLASSVADYDSERVLNLDDDPMTNFAVYANSTIILSRTEGTNVVISADHEKLIYELDNIDQTVAGLKPGDIVAYPYSDLDTLVLKVATINIDGARAVITGDEVKMEDVFSYVKVENEGDSDNLIVDENSGDNDVTYIGLIQDGKGPENGTLEPFGKDPSVEGNLALGFKLDKKSGSVTVKGTLSLDIKLKLSYYISPSRQFIEFKDEVKTKLSVSVSGEAELPVVSLPNMGFSPIPGVDIKLKPEIVLSFKAKVEFTTTVENISGFSFENGVVTDLTTPCAIKADVNIEGTIFFGLDLNPTIEIAGGFLGDITYSMLCGVELKAENKGADYEDSTLLGKQEPKNSKHECRSCLSIKITGKKESKLEIALLKLDYLTFSIKVSESKFEIGNCYYSIDRQTFGWGDCPYKTYRVTVHVEDEQGNDVKDSTVIAVVDDLQTEIALGKTDGNGIITQYLNAGKYTFSATMGDTVLEKIVTVEDACKIELNKYTLNSSLIGVINPDDITDRGIVATGNCGANGSQIKWTMYGNGLLELNGNGEMQNYRYNYAPWYQYQNNIKMIILSDGIENIGDCAFESCSVLQQVSIPQSVTRIERGAFSNCIALEKVNFPDKLTRIGQSAFEGCEALGNVKLPASLIELESYAFYGCVSMDDVILPASLTELGEGAFQLCKSITKITVPKSVKEIYANTFKDCEKLSDVVIEGEVHRIGKQAFRGCSSLKNIALPNSLEIIDRNAFSDCASLFSISIPKNVTQMNWGAFSGCSNLKQVHCYDMVSWGSITFDWYANPLTNGGGLYIDGDLVTHLQWPEELSQIKDHAFDGYAFITNAVIPEGVTSIGVAAFQDCDSLKTISLPDSVESISSYAFCGSGITEIQIPDRVTEISDLMFQWCDQLEIVRLGRGITSIGTDAFAICGNMKEIWFTGNAPTHIGYGAFLLTSCTAYYPLENQTWVDFLAKYSGGLNWVAYSLSGGNSLGQDEKQDSKTEEKMSQAAPQSYEEIIQENRDETGTASPNAVYKGEYETDFNDGYAVKKATFYDLVPGADYILLALEEIDIDNILQPSNLQYIQQAAAAEDGTLTFTYVQREDTDISYVMACGASHKDLKDAIIQFPPMAVCGSVRVVDPKVYYDGELLTEGIDYVISGTVDYENAGEYTCYIRGIQNYTGLVECKYTVLLTAPGDINGDGVVDNKDLTRLFQHLSGWEAETFGNLDLNGDGKVDNKDLTRLFQYLSGWEVELK